MEACKDATQAEAPILELDSGATPFPAHECRRTGGGSSPGSSRPMKLYRMTLRSQRQVIRS